MSEQSAQRILATIERSYPTLTPVLKVFNGGNCAICLKEMHRNKLVTAFIIWNPGDWYSFKDRITSQNGGQAA
jgi:hypothetical protein